MLGLMTYDKLAFVSHLGNKIKRANQELHALSRENIYVGF